MKNHRKVIIGIVVLLMTGTIHATFQNGNKLYGFYQDYKKESGSFNAGVYGGYVIGVADAFDDVTFSIPSYATQGQILDVVGKYLENHPEVRHNSAFIIVSDALAKVFPLKNPNN